MAAVSHPRDERTRILASDKKNYANLLESTEDRLGSVRQYTPPVSEKIYTRQLDGDTIERVNRSNKKLSLVLYHLANEPSVGLYHVNDHVTRTIPKLIGVKHAIKSKVKHVEEIAYDMDSTIATIQSLHSLDTFQSITRLLRSSTQSVDYMLRGIPMSASSSNTSQPWGPASVNVVAPVMQQQQQQQPIQQAYTTPTAVEPQPQPSVQASATVAPQPVTHDTAPTKTPEIEPQQESEEPAQPESQQQDLSLPETLSSSANPSETPISEATEPEQPEPTALPEEVPPPTTTQSTDNESIVEGEEQQQQQQQEGVEASTSPDVPLSSSPLTSSILANHLRAAPPSKKKKGKKGDLRPKNF